MMNRTKLAACFVLTLVNLACDRRPSEPRPRAAPALPSAPQREPSAETRVPNQQPGKKLNLIFLTVEALRADMPWSGYAKAIAPNLSRLAAQSVVYENHRSLSSSTAQTVGTWMTGRFASTLFRNRSVSTDYLDSNEWITEAMKRGGVTTLAVQASPDFERTAGLRQGFDSFEMISGLDWKLGKDQGVTSDRSVAKIIELLSDDKNTRGQFFIWSHLMDPHSEYRKHDAAPDFGSDRRGRYDSEVFHMDLWIGRLLEFCRKQRWWSNTALIMSSDHGEAFGEHGMYGHGLELWEVLTRVPLVIHVPGLSAKQVSEARTHLDLAPTILELMGLPRVQGMQGQSMVPEIYGTEPAFPREAVVLEELAEDESQPARRALLVGNYKLIVFGDGAKKALFDLSSDPGEQKDLSAKEPSLLKALSDKLDVYFGKLPVVLPEGEGQGPEHKKQH